jgi:hypothetical protein
MPQYYVIRTLPVLFIFVLILFLVCAVEASNKMYIKCVVLAIMYSCSRLEREPSIVPSTPLTPRSVLFSSDEEYRTASEGGRRESEDWGEPLAPLPPSPPLNRTPISRVKEKAR